MVKIQVNSQGKAYMTSNNKVLLANEGGSTPTLITKAISENGTYSASSDSADGYSEVTVNVSGGSSSKYGVSIDNFIGDVDSNGVLSSPSSINGITFTGVTEISNYALYNTFNKNIIRGVISFPDLIVVDNSGLNHAFEGNQITSVDLSVLTTIEERGLENAFSNNQITSVDLSSLTTIRDAGLLYAFSNNQITSVDLSSLTTIGGYGLWSAFIGNGTLQTIYFRSLTSNSFTDGNKTAFNSMISSCENVTVHFPSNLQSVIGDWDDVTNGFGGTNTTVLFDLPATE